MGKLCGIYKITSPTGAIYIGQSVDILVRKTRYKKLSCKKQYRIYNSILKHGWDSHIFEIIDQCDVSKLNELEIYYIQFYNSFNSEHGMNLTEGGNSRGITDEIRKRMSEAKKGNKNRIGCIHSEETKDKIKNTKRGNFASEETKDKMSISRLGKKIHTKESKEKLSILHTGKHLTESTKEKLRNINLGHKHTNETKLKMSTSKIGNKSRLGCVKSKT